MIGRARHGLPAPERLQLLGLRLLRAVHLLQLARRPAPNAGWFNYVPLSTQAYSPGTNIDFWALGLIFLGISTTAGAINFIVTIFKLRAPGMSLNRMPLFVWAILVTSFAIIFAIPPLTAANFLLELHRSFGSHFFDAAAGGNPLLWQHLFWVFGHPDVYIIFLPAVGIVSTILPVLSRRPIVRLRAGGAGDGRHRHHRLWRLGPPHVRRRPAAAVAELLQRRQHDDHHPQRRAGVRLAGHHLEGRPSWTRPLLFVLGFLVTFVMGGVTGVMFAVVPFDRQVTTPTSSSPTSTTCWSAAPSSRSSPPSTTGCPR